MRMTEDAGKKEVNCQLQSAGRPTWAEINLNAMADNYRALTSLLSPSSAGYPRILPVVKADAYGHGMIPVARALAAAGVTMFAVGLVEEGIALRQAGISQSILVLATVWPGLEPAAIKNDLILAIDTPESVRRLEMAARSLAVSAPVHIKVDTGMARLGVRWNAMDPLLASIGQANHVGLKGVFSHLSSADETDPAYTNEQASRFEHSLSLVRKTGLDPGEIHLANSAGLLYHEKFRQWSVRSGIAIYGYSPDPRRSPVTLRPVLSFKTTVGPIRSLAAGEPIGYGRKFTAARPTRLAILPVGYADGFSRGFSGRGKVIIRDKWAEVLGNVSMDMIAVDLTDSPDVREGDEVTLLGSSPHCRMAANEWADALETIPYEVLCGIAARVPRVYVNGN
jgi:alanine racemase